MGESGRVPYRDREGFGSQKPARKVERIRSESLGLGFGVQRGYPKTQDAQVCGKMSDAPEPL